MNKRETVEYYRRWRAKNRIRIRQLERIRYALNRERILARKRDQRNRTREATNARIRLWYAKNREKIIIQKRTLRERNRDRYLEYELRSRNKNIEKRRESDRRLKERQRRNRGIPSLTDIRKYYSRPDVIEAQRNRRSIYNSNYHQKHKKRLARKEKLRRAANYEQYLAYHRAYSRRNIAKKLARAKTPEARARAASNARRRRKINPRLTLRQSRAAYKRWRKKRPDYYVNRSQSLVDQYVRNLLAHAYKETPLPPKLFPSEIVEIKRKQIRLLRAIKQRKVNTCTLNTSAA